ncbi:toll/interleukin-1 receptor domain-containing protein [Kutzneria albida]|uniref:TIR domain-containing protein n=1 Tax=Kutzneria albida DSM 43870 TaxID=1449976 RepID=W5W9Z9_9PSEU|nr:toll/interleukin-1 receptor domain-containing protein [Kutzneria albida]AHH97585.1 hypothetical protein KALB_4222 [Kutzneria albida DSM 43870]
MSFKYDLFISHAYEDKGEFVRPLVTRLNRFHVSVWYDEHSLQVGDSLSGSIDRGLRESKFGLLVITKSFLKKAWPEYEYRSLLTREVGKEKVVLPIWHGVSRDDVLEYSAWLADKVALVTSDKDSNEIAAEILAVVKPEIYQTLRRVQLATEYRRSLPTVEVPLNELARNPSFFHDHLPKVDAWRVRLTHEALKEVFPETLEGAINEIRRDKEYENEVHLWERIAAVYLYIKGKYSLNLQECNALFLELLDASLGTSSKKKHRDAARFPWLTEAAAEFNRQLPHEVE